MQTSYSSFIALVTFDQSYHKIEQQIAQNHKAVQTLDQKVQQAQTQLLDMQQKHETLRNDVALVEKEVTELQDKEQALQKAVQAISSSKEYNAGLKDLDYVRATRQAAEQKYMQLLQKQEDMQKKLDQAKAEYETLFVATETEKQAIHAAVAQLQEERKSLQPERDALEAAVQPDILERYQMMRHKVSNPVVQIQQDSCSVCFYALTPREVQAVMQHQLVQCKECYRLLYQP